MKMQFSPAFLTTIFLAILFSSCSENKEKDKPLLSILTESIETSDQLIDRSIDDQIRSLESKLAEARSNYKAKIWLPIARQISNTSNQAIGYLDSVGKLIQNDNVAASKLFDGSINEKSFYSRLLQFRDSLLNVDPSIKVEFAGSFIIVSKQYDSLLLNRQEKTKDLVNGLDELKVLALLKSILSNFKKNETRLLAYCDLNASARASDFTSFSAIIGQNSRYLKPGDNLEILAGVGGFQMFPQAKYWINGKLINPGDDLAAHLIFKVENKPGKYSIPVKLEYKDADGKPQTIEKTIEYEVAKLCDGQN
jgi:hypothetical protein